MTEKKKIPFTSTMSRLERAAAPAAPADDQLSFADVAADELKETLLATDLNTLTPLEAMNLLYTLQKKARG